MQREGAGAPVPRAAVPAQLLAVVADVDGRPGLLAYDLEQRLMPQPVELGRVDRFGARDIWSRVSSGGRGRLPVWVARIRSSLRRIVAPTQIIR
jgi:hypothetical protein